MGEEDDPKSGTKTKMMEKQPRTMSAIKKPEIKETKGIVTSLKNIDTKKVEAKARKEEAKVNKDAKATKRDSKEETKAKKDMIELIIIANTENAAKTEEKITALGDTIAGTLKEEVKISMKEMTEAITTAMAQRPNNTHQEEQYSKMEEQIQELKEKLRNTENQPAGRLDSNSQPQTNMSERPEDKTPEDPPTIPNGQGTSSNTHQQTKSQTPAVGKNQATNMETSKQQMCDIINQLINRVQYLEQQIDKPEPFQRQGPTWPKLPGQGQQPIGKFLPTVNIDLQGNNDSQNITREQNQPIDFTVVKRSRRPQQPRPEIQGPIKEVIEKDLGEHIQKQRDENIKRKPQKDMNHETRDDIIKDMLKKQQLYVGIAPISNQQINNAMERMVERGVLKRKDPLDERIQRTIKSILKGWAHKNLKMTDREWDEIEIDKITQTYTEGSNILFLKCRTQEDTVKITSKAKHLPQDSTGEEPRLVMYVDNRAKSR